MGSLLLDHLKKQTTSFLQEKYKVARMTFTDVTEAELLAEEATNKDDCSPDAKTMTRIAEASFDVDDYWRIVDVLHKRLYNVDWEQWRQCYKALVLLEFLLTHGPHQFAREFQCDTEIIEELGCFTHIDDRGFNWGARMQKLSDQILKFLLDGEALKEARLKALKITNEIQGFGSSLNSPTSSSASPCSSSTISPGSSSFCSFSTISTPAFFDSNEKIQPPSIGDHSNNIIYRSKSMDKSHIWDGSAAHEKHVLIDSDGDDDVQKPKGFVSGIYSKIIGSGTSEGSRDKIEFRCISGVGKNNNKVITKKLDRQYSLWF